LKNDINIQELINKFVAVPHPDLLKTPPRQPAPSAAPGPLAQETVAELLAECSDQTPDRELAMLKAQLGPKFVEEQEKLFQRLQLLHLDAQATSAAGDKLLNLKD
jgi:hypothetical protein